LVIEDISEKFIPRVNKRRDDREFRDFIEQSRRKIPDTNARREVLRQQITSVSNRLRDCAGWAIQARQSDFLKNVGTPTAPSLISLRLTESPTYGPIYTKFSKVMGDALKPLQKVLHLIENIFQGKVRPTWELYEIWCFAKLYSGFILYTTLKPEANEPDLFQCLSLNKDGSILLPKEREFKLICMVDNYTNLEATLVYEPKLTNREGQQRTPDISIQTKVGFNPPREYFFDAKYRNYRQQGSDTLINDVLNTARDKYQDELEATACFILHSDAEVDYWGEVPFDRFLQESVLDELDELEWPGHEYGAISLVPGLNEDRQLRKICRLLFQYHDSSLSTVCLSCGYKLRAEENLHTTWMPDRISERELINRVVNNSGKSGNGTGVYCSCPQCGDFWVIQSCYGDSHPLLKFNNSFHRNSDHPEFKNKWMYICPDCGSDPSPEDLNQKGIPQMAIDINSNF
jgi:hypothetical protein